MKSFPTSLLVALAALSVHVFFLQIVFFTSEQTSDLCDYHFKYLFFAWRKATKGIRVSDLWRLAKRPGFDGNTRLSAEDQEHATWQAHGCHMAQPPLSDQFT